MNKLIPKVGLLKEIKLYKDNIFDSYFDDNAKNESKTIKLYKEIKQEDGSITDEYQPEVIFRILRGTGSFSGWAPERKDQARLAYLYNIVR